MSSLKRWQCCDHRYQSRFAPLTAVAWQLLTKSKIWTTAQQFRMHNAELILAAGTWQKGQALSQRFLRKLWQTRILNQRIFRNLNGRDSTLWSSLPFDWPHRRRDFCHWQSSAVRPRCSEWQPFCSGRKKQPISVAKWKSNRIWLLFGRATIFSCSLLFTVAAAGRQWLRQMNN